MSDVSQTAPPAERKLTPAEEAFQKAMGEVPMSQEDVAEAKRISASGAGIRYVRITPGVAKALFTLHNVKGTNRGFSFAKAQAYRAAMVRGEWRRVHQGIAFYPDGNLGDGQHRMAACALSGASIEVSASSDLDRESVLAIDRVKARNGGEWLEMAGVREGKVKAVIAKSAMEYSLEVDTGTKPILSDEQVVKFVMDHSQQCTTAIDIGRKSHDGAVNPVLTIRQAANVSLLMLMGGYAEQRVREFMACVQTGQAGFPESPTTAFSQRMFRAIKSDRYKDQVSGKSFLALAMEAAALWEQHVSVSRLNVNIKKQVPSYHRPVETADMGIVPVANPHVAAAAE